MRPTPAERDPAQARRSTLVLALALLGTVAAYLPALHGAFVFDDLAILEEPLVRAPGRFLSLTTWATGYRPLVTLSYALDHAAWGFSPFGWHVTSLAGHLVASLLAFWFVRRTLQRAGAERPDAPAAAAAALFAMHPLQTESVTYLWQRAESFAGVLYLATLLVLLEPDDAERPGRRWLRLAEAAAGSGDYSAARTALAQVAALPSQANAGAAQEGRTQLHCR
jgi:hypothetical protein